MPARRVAMLALLNEELALSASRHQPTDPATGPLGGVTTAA